MDDDSGAGCIDWIVKNSICMDVAAMVQPRYNEKTRTGEKLPSCRKRGGKGIEDLFRADGRDH